MRDKLVLIIAFSMITMSLKFCSCVPWQGCRQFDSLGNEATYCRIHREAVWAFVEIDDVTQGQTNRVLSIDRLLKKLKNYNSFEGVETEISADTIARGFNSIYLAAHQRAEQKRNNDAMDIKEITLCGFENGLNDWFDNLKLEVNHAN